MLIRIVRLVFRPEFVPQFEQVFQESAAHIRAFPGCEHLELWRDEKYDNIFYTHSHWQSKEHLNTYRHSELFKTTWAKTKIGFCDRPQAFSTFKIMDVESV